MPHNANNLHVVQKARVLAIDVHAALNRHRRALRDEAPSLRTQMLRAVDSILLNLSEGAGKDSPDAFAYYIEIAIGSCNELEAQLDLALGIKVLPLSARSLMDRTIEVRKMSFGLRRTVLRDGARRETRLGTHSRRELREKRTENPDT